MISIQRAQMRWECTAAQVSVGRAVLRCEGTRLRSDPATCLSSDPAAPGLPESRRIKEQRLARLGDSANPAPLFLRSLLRSIPPFCLCPLDSVSLCLCVGVCDCVCVCACFALAVSFPSFPLWLQASAHSCPLVSVGPRTVG